MLYTNKTLLTCKVKLANGDPYNLYVRPEHCLIYKDIAYAFDLVFEDGTTESYQLLPNNKTKEVLRQIVDPIVNHPTATYWLVKRSFPLVARIAFSIMGMRKDVEELIEHLEDYLMEDSSYYNVRTLTVFINDKVYTSNIPTSDLRKSKGSLY